MNKEKVFGFVKKNEKEREKEVMIGTAFITLGSLIFIGTLTIADSISKINLVDGFFLNSLIQFGILLGVFFLGGFSTYLIVNIFTKNYKLKEIKK